MREPQAIIFDMDGVLIDSEPIHYEIEKKLFEKLGIVVPEEVHRCYLGASGDFMYGDLKSRYRLADTVEILLEQDDLFRCDYFKGLEEIKLNEGVLSLLKEIKTSGLRMAVATSSSPEMAAILLARCGINSLFDSIVTTVEAGKSKPAPDVYLMAAQKIGVIPANCIVFEDSPNGISSAKEAGMFCVAVQTDGVTAQELSKADVLVNSFVGLNLQRLFELIADKCVLQPPN